MKRMSWRNLFFAAAVFSFSCLLLVGGSRLIAAPDHGTSVILPSESWMEASFTCPPLSVEQNLPAVQVGEGKARCDSSLSIDDDRLDMLLLPNTDANGNIIRHASYMRAVYQTFALGDGFV